MGFGIILRGCRGALVWFCFVWLPFLRFWKGAAAPTKSGSGPGLVRVWFLNPGLVPANRLGDGLGRLGGVSGTSWDCFGGDLGCLGAFLEVFERLGSVLEAQGGVLGVLGGVLGRLGSVLGGRWRCVDVSLKAFEGFEASWEGPGGGRAAS